MDNFTLDRTEQMERVLHEKITILHEQLTGLEAVLDQYRQLRQSLLESEMRFRLMIENVKDYAIFMLDVDGKIVSWNLGAAHIKGYHADEIIGQHFSVFYTPGDQANGKPFRGLATARNEGRFLDEGWRVRKDGTQFWASVVITALHDARGTLIGFAKITRDLTERKRMEDALARNYEAQEAIRMRDAFLAVAAHELKTPITNLQGFAQVTLRHLEKAETLDRARVLRAFQMIDTQTDKLGQLVKQLLDVAQIQVGETSPPMSRVNLTELTQQVIALTEAQTTQHTISLQSPDDVTIEADPLRLEQVLVNLLNNAVKYSPHGGQISVVIEELGASDVRVSIADQGIGIPEAEREQIFEPFYRVYSDVEQPTTSGAGLGLFISRQIIAEHQGQLSVETVADGGSRFVITLPVQRPTAVKHT